jgi:hypothetical protein
MFAKKWSHQVYGQNTQKLKPNYYLGVQPVSRVESLLLKEG